MNLFHPTTAEALALIIAVIIPAISSLLSRAHWDLFWTGVITLVLNAVTGFVTEWADSNDVNHYDWKAALGIALTGLFISFISRYVILRGTTVDAKLLAVGSKEPAPVAPVAPAA